MGVKCFYETFVLKQTAVHLLNICAKNPPPRQYPKTLPATPNERQCYYQLTNKNSTAHPHISAHLQAAQSQHTTHTCKRATILPPLTPSTAKQISKKFVRLTKKPLICEQ
jgi:hypothetical protein